MAQAGADVVVMARRVDRLQETARAVKETGRRCLVVRGDVTSTSDCESAVLAATDAFGAVDVLVNNAGVGTAYPALREAAEEFRRVIDVNLCGSFWMAQSCARVMRPGASMVNVGSALGMTTAGLPQAAYCAQARQPSSA